MNNVSFTGRLTKDPETGYGASCNAYARFTLAVDREMSKDGKKQADFINVSCFGQQAEFAEKYLTKGKLIGITGSLRTSSYEKDGKRYYSWAVIPSRIEFLGKKDESTQQPAAQEQPAQMPMDDDDIPF